MKLILGDCIEKLKDMETNSISSVVTDPPYELGFMGKKWDGSGIAYNVNLWKEVLRIMKPGAHLLSFGGSRTYHRMACAIEDAGFEVRDCIMWIYGSGFPKSLNISKSLDKKLGVEPSIVGDNPNHRPISGVNYTGVYAGGNTGSKYLTAPTSDAAKRWEGWGTALKPAYEPIIVARKPLEGSVSDNVLKHGTGGINVDGSRIDYRNEADKLSATPQGACTSKSGALAGGTQHDGDRKEYARSELKGRWPANVFFDEEAARLLDEQTGELKAGVASGGASRFFYVAKASRKERELGCDHLPSKTGAEATDRKENTAGLDNPRAGAGRTASEVHNFHPTVKPVQLLRYLIKLVTPPGGVVLDPFMGSGTTGISCILEGFDFIGIEKEEEYMEIAKARIDYYKGLKEQIII